MRKLPVIGITSGDPGGIGPEITLKALTQEYPECRLVVFGTREVFRHNARILALPFDEDRIEFVDVPMDGEPYFGPDPLRAGKTSVAYLDTAFSYYRDGKIDGLATGPIHKASWHRCGYHYPGQTEFCAERTGSSEFFMLMAGAHFRIALLSTHLSLRDALEKVRLEDIVRQIRLIHREFQKLGWQHPRIGCAALNPHAGEEGAFGSEEADAIEPALHRLRAEGILVDGPLAPEVIFRVAAAEDRWDVILAMYHDQAMIPLKLLDFDQSANVTMGLPLIRTSPDHGTAFDIAGKGKANPGSMILSIRLAAEWTGKRMVNDEGKEGKEEKKGERRRAKGEGRILALDVGMKRIGIAMTDELQMIASPYSVIERNKATVVHIQSLVAEKGIRRIIVGLPLRLDGTEGGQAADVRSFVKKLEAQVAVDIVLWDERLSTVEAEERASHRKPGKQKHGVDARAAAVILESYLNR